MLSEAERVGRPHSISVASEPLFGFPFVLSRDGFPDDRIMPEIIIDMIRGRDTCPLSAVGLVVALLVAAGCFAVASYLASSLIWSPPVALTLIGLGAVILVSIGSGVALRRIDRRKTVRPRLRQAD